MVHVVHDAGLDHRQRAAPTFLGRLKDEFHGAGDAVPHPAQDFRDRESDRGVGVVRAGMHHARMGGDEALARRQMRLGVVLQDRQRVHVHAQRNHRAGGGPGEGCDHRRVPAGKRGEERCRSALGLGAAVGAIELRFRRQADTARGIHHVPPEPHTEAKLGQPLRDQARGAELGQAELRMAVQIPTQRDRAGGGGSQGSGGKIGGGHAVVLSMAAGLRRRR